MIHKPPARLKHYTHTSDRLQNIHRPHTRFKPCRAYLIDTSKHYTCHTWGIIQNIVHVIPQTRFKTLYTYMYLRHASIYTYMYLRHASKHTHTSDTLKTCRSYLKHTSKHYTCHTSDTLQSRLFLFRILVTISRWQHLGVMITTKIHLLRYTPTEPTTEPTPGYDFPEFKRISYLRIGY